LINVSEKSDEELATHGYAAILEIIQKRIFEQNFLSHFERVLKLGVMQEINDLCGGEYLEMLLKYVLDKSNIAPDDLDDLFNLVIEHVPREEEAMGTLADNLRAQGFEKGKLEGKLEGVEEGEERGKAEEKAANIRQLLKVGIEPSKIMAAFALTKKELDQYIH
jgi:recombination-promoting nuclease RpnB